MNVIDGCVVLCGYCDKEIGQEPDALKIHLKSGECSFMEANYQPLTILIEPLKDERVIDWLAS